MQCIFFILKNVLLVIIRRWSHSVVLGNLVLTMHYHTSSDTQMLGLQARYNMPCFLHVLFNFLLFHFQNLSVKMQEFQCRPGPHKITTINITVFYLCVLSF